MTVIESAQRFETGASGRGARRHGRRWLVVAVLLVLAAVLGWLVWWSPVLAVREVRVLGVQEVSADQVRAVAGVSLGTPLARVRGAQVAARVAAITGVRDAEVRYGWPNTLVVVVTERTPVATVGTGADRLLLDAQGVAYAPPSGRVPAGLPEVRATQGARAAAAGVLAGLPSGLAARVRVVRADTLDDVELVLAGGVRVRWGADSDGPRKAAVLTALLAQRPQEVDVSAPELPTTRGGRTPAAGDQAAG